MLVRYQAKVGKVFIPYVVEISICWWGTRRICWWSTRRICWWGTIFVGEVLRICWWGIKYILESNWTPNDKIFNTYWWGIRLKYIGAKASFDDVFLSIVHALKYHCKIIRTMGWPVSGSWWGATFPRHCKGKVNWYLQTMPCKQKWLFPFRYCDVYSMDVLMNIIKWFDQRNNTTFYSKIS